MQDLRVTIIQTSLFWEDKAKNIEMFSQKISSISELTDLIVLPEMFTTGFSMKPVLFAEETEAEALNNMRSWAKQKGCVVTGSIICKDGNRYFNRLLWVRPDGSFDKYDKRHLFRFAGEDKHYSAGREKLIVDLKGWRIRPLICFDLRFPVWSRNRQDYDCLIFMANWPEARSKAWSTLLEARAHENQCYVVGVNRIGKDGKDIDHSGNSAVIEPKGNLISTTQPHQENIETVILPWDELAEFREKFPVALDADDFEIKI